MITTINQFKKINESNNKFNVGDMVYVNPFGPETYGFNDVQSDKSFRPRIYNVDLDTQYQIILVDNNQYGIFDNDNNYIELDDTQISFTPFENTENQLPYKKFDESFHEGDEELYHELDWNDIENKFMEFSSTYSKGQYASMRQTFNFLKDEIEKYKMLN